MLSELLGKWTDERAADLLRIEHLPRLGITVYKYEITDRKSVV